MESPHEGRRHVEPVLRTDEDAPPPDQPESQYLSLDELLFGAVSRQVDAAPETSRDPVDEPPLLDDDRFVEEHEFGDHEELIDEDVVGDDELALDDTIVAEPAEIDDATDPTGPERGRRRAWVLAGLVTLIVVAGTAVGAVVVGGRSADSAPRKSGSVRKAPSGTTTPTVPTTVLPSTASTPAPATTEPLTAATASRAVPLPTGAPTQPSPPPATPSPPSTSPPPPSTSPPTTSPPPSTTSPP